MIMHAYMHATCARAHTRAHNQAKEPETRASDAGDRTISLTDGPKLLFLNLLRFSIQHLSEDAVCACACVCVCALVRTCCRKRSTSIISALASSSCRDLLDRTSETRKIT